MLTFVLNTFSSEPINLFDSIFNCVALNNEFSSKSITEPAKASKVIFFEVVISFRTNESLASKSVSPLATVEVPLAITIEPASANISNVFASPRSSILTFWAMAFWESKETFPVSLKTSPSKKRSPAERRILSVAVTIPLRCISPVRFVTIKSPSESIAPTFKASVSTI